MLRGGRDDTLRALISSEHVYLLAKNPRDKEYVILDPSFDELINCRAVIQGQLTELVCLSVCINWQQNII